MTKAVIATAFPRARSVAKTFGLSTARANALVGLMDRIAANGATAYRMTASRKGSRVVKRKKK